MRYAVMGGGKRLRPCLTLAVAEARGASAAVSPRPTRARSRCRPPCAVEIDPLLLARARRSARPWTTTTLRRGRPTTHVVFGDGLAILAGDGLLTEAFVVLARRRPRARAGAPAARRPNAAARDRGARRARRAPRAWSAARRSISRRQARCQPQRAGSRRAPALEDMHARKTGALIRAARDPRRARRRRRRCHTMRAVDDYARELGLAFQIIDDVLDVEGSTDALGKTAGKDAAAGKPTYPALFGIDGSRRSRPTASRAPSTRSPRPASAAGSPRSPTGA